MWHAAYARDGEKEEGLTFASAAFSLILQVRHLV